MRPFQKPSKKPVFRGKTHKLVYQQQSPNIIQLQHQLVGVLVGLLVGADMGKRTAEKSALAVAALRAPGKFSVGGCDGLQLQILDSGAKSWILRVLIAGKRRHIGLGGYPEISLADARKAAKAMRQQIRDGLDPIAKRQAARLALREQAAALTFDQCAARYIQAKAPEWRNPKHRLQWETTLHQYASPLIGSLPVHAVELRHLVQILEPLWTQKTETASRLRGRIQAVLDWATVRGLRHGDNPARWRGHLDKLLPAPNRTKDERHCPAVPVADAGAFMAALRQREGVSARCLEFVMLTACRSGEARGATWQEFDLDAALWTVPASRMKAGREHRQPLSDAALRLLSEARANATGDMVFPAPRGGALSDMALSALMRRMDYRDASGAVCVPHGLRSTFRDWASEQTGFARELIEQALAHTNSNKVEAAYLRTDLLAKRARLMQQWADFCDRVQLAGEVVKLKGKAK